MIIVSFVVGLIIGLALMGFASSVERKETTSRLNELLRMAKDELDDAESRIEELHGELIVKQNVIDSQNKRINRQLKIINKNKNGRTDVQGNPAAPVCE